MHEAFVESCINHWKATSPCARKSTLAIVLTELWPSRVYLSTLACDGPDPTKGDATSNQNLLAHDLDVCTKRLDDILFRCFPFRLAGVWVEFVTYVGTPSQKLRKVKAHFEGNLENLWLMYKRSLLNACCQYYIPFLSLGPFSIKVSALRILCNRSFLLKHRWNRCSSH